MKPKKMFFQQPQLQRAHSRCLVRRAWKRGRCRQHTQRTLKSWLSRIGPRCPYSKMKHSSKLQNRHTRASNTAIAGPAFKSSSFEARPPSLEKSLQNPIDPSSEPFHNYDPIILHTLRLRSSSPHAPTKPPTAASSCTRSPGCFDRLPRLAKAVYTPTQTIKMAYSAFQGLSLLISEPDAFGHHSSSPRSATSIRSDVTTPRTWSAPPSRANSVEPAMAIEQRDVVDVRCAPLPPRAPDSNPLAAWGLSAAGRLA